MLQFAALRTFRWSFFLTTKQTHLAKLNLWRRLSLLSWLRGLMVLRRLCMLRWYSIPCCKVIRSSLWNFSFCCVLSLPHLRMITRTSYSKSVHMVYMVLSLPLNAGTQIYMFFYTCLISQFSINLFDTKFHEKFKSNQFKQFYSHLWKMGLEFWGAEQTLFFVHQLISRWETTIMVFNLVDQLYWDKHLDMNQY